MLQHLLLQLCGCISLKHFISQHCSVYEGLFWKDVKVTKNSWALISQNENPFFKNSRSKYQRPISKGCNMKIYQQVSIFCFSFLSWGVCLFLSPPSTHTHTHTCTLSENQACSIKLLSHSVYNETLGYF